MTGSKESTTVFVFVPSSCSEDTAVTGSKHNSYASYVIVFVPFSCSEDSAMTGSKGSTTVFVFVPSSCSEDTAVTESKQQLCIIRNCFCTYFLLRRYSYDWV